MPPRRRRACPHRHSKRSTGAPHPRDFVPWRFFADRRRSQLPSAPRRLKTLYGAFVVKGSQPAIILFLHQFLCSIWKPVSSPRPTRPQCCRAQGPSRLVVAPTLTRASSTAGHTLTAPSTAAHSLWSDDKVRGEPACGARILVPHPCIRWVRRPHHDAVMRISSKLRGGGPILHNGIKAVVFAGTPPPRTVIGNPSQGVRTGPKPSGIP